MLPEACRRQLYDLYTRFDIQFYSDARDSLLKAMVESLRYKYSIDAASMT